MSTGAVLAPLRRRYTGWMELDAEQVLVDRDEAAQDIRAMQLILRLERDPAPSWHSAVGLAASAAALICLDPRAEPGGEWHEAIADYCAGHIRKVTRRARGAQWEATADLPGLTLTDGDTQIRALLPGRVVEPDKRVSKLQVGGTDVDRDDPPARLAQQPPGGALTLVLPTEPAMTLGKAMAQAGHAGMIAAALLAQDDQPALARWVEDGCSARVELTSGFAGLVDGLADPGRAWREQRLLGVRDAGFTEVDPGTVTVVAFAPFSPPR